MEILTGHRPFVDLVIDVASARSVLIEAEKQTSVSRAAETTARNRYNDATKALDAAMADLRKLAPRGTDWSTG